MATLFALKRPFLGVNCSYMIHHNAAYGEAFPTKFASIRPFTGVRPQMGLHISVRLVVTDEATEQPVRVTHRQVGKVTTRSAF